MSASSGSSSGGAGGSDGMYSEWELFEADDDVEDS